jgi:cyanophycin synthetase
LRTWPRVDAFEVELKLCFEDSRRLMGHSRFNSGPAAILTTVGPDATDADSVTRWYQVASTLVSELGWNGVSEPEAYRHTNGYDLVIPCPPDRLYTATEINEHAWEVGCGVGDVDDNFQYTDSGFDVHQRFRDGRDVREYFRAIDVAEREPVMNALRAEAESRKLPVFADDDDISIGAGAGSATYAIKSLPSPIEVPWTQLRSIPIAMVTGSNGKTTTTRLIAAMLEASSEGFKGHVGISSTEGVAIGGEWVNRGDYSGPGGARLVLRDKRVTAAVLETARGGILRRGLAVDRADVALVTNISADHFGEYGVESLDDLADVKMALARTLDRDGTLALNADDPLLLARANKQTCKVALFSLDDDSAPLKAHREKGGVTCGVREGAIWLSQGGVQHLLGSIGNMPLTVGGAASYNVANLAAASLAAAALGVQPSVIADVLMHFGKSRGDNPGRLERWALQDVNALIDYAHNPDGLARLLAVGRTLIKGDGRLLLLLGQAGNRDNDAIAELAATAAQANPDRVVIKELPTMLRGRQPGEVPALLDAGLRAAGFPSDAIAFEVDEMNAVRRLLGEARSGDVVVLPVHQSKARETASALLDEMERAGWRAGQSLPP